ncbi:60S ribosomal protein L23a-like [Prionailurus bengalensis]|uniref:60S ribosomal protein L23a-like n=1 Tax=Prionailurus bengalensis TaxID=37029 RepID=UPI001CA931AD|nr:60S ribosomal protein L23a-like [Prionailurus bengalensis]
MVPKVKKEAPPPPKAEAKAKTEAKVLKAKKAVLEGIHSHFLKKDPEITYILTAQDTASPKAAQYPPKSTPRRIKLDPYAIKFPPSTESAVKKIEDHNTLVFIVDV